MCDLRDDDVRSMDAGSGKLTQCLKCGTMGVQIGTAYFAVQPSEIYCVRRWLDQVRVTETARIEARQTLFLQMQSSRIMLALTPGEIDDLNFLLRVGCLWASSTTLPTYDPVFLESVN